MQSHDELRKQEHEQAQIWGADKDFILVAHWYFFGPLWPLLVSKCITMGQCYDPSNSIIIMERGTKILMRHNSLRCQSHFDVFFKRYYYCLATNT